MEELFAASEIRMTLVVRDPGGESASAHGDEEGRREGLVCGSLGEAPSTFEAETGRSGPEKGRENVEVE